MKVNKFWLMIIAIVLVWTFILGIIIFDKPTYSSRKDNFTYVHSIKNSSTEVKFYKWHDNRGSTICVAISYNYNVSRPPVVSISARGD
jgi:hypothetical protein